MNLSHDGGLGPLEFSAEGLRLQKLEVYNWGTFDKQVWSFTPRGETTLLTGDSGSGKSTLVDALITLFVSPRKLAYNKAADASAKERTITSYVRGYYGQKYAYEGKGKPEALREANQYSVLLATLSDECLGQTVTLAAFFYFQEQQANPKRFYVLAEQELSITQNFTCFGGNVKQLRATLKEAGCEVFDEHHRYAERYQKVLGNLKPQAIDLFQQTVSMKKVEALTEFVRSNMLEETDIAVQIDKLLEHYSSLNSAYEAVQRARRQARQLRPICDNGAQYAEQRSELACIETGRLALEGWFAAQKANLYEQRIAQLEERQAEIKAQLRQKRQALAKLEADIRQLEQDIYQNGGGALERLKETLAHMRQTQQSRNQRVVRYGQNAATIGLKTPDSQIAFAENQKSMQGMRGLLQQEQAAAQEELTQVSIKLQSEKNQKQELEEEIASLRGRTSNIPKGLISLRENLCHALAISQEMLPFAGELIEVKESESAWEGAIERLLHGFALSLLVSEQNYAQVSQWVNERNLGAKLVYFATRPRQGDEQPLNPAAAANKLAVNPQTPFAHWLTRELAQRADHVCCMEMTTFLREKRAISQTGQIKSAARHEKDDRKNLCDPTRYVLGFSNQKKIQALLQQVHALGETIAQWEAKKETAGRNLTSLNAREQALNALETVCEYSELDVRGIGDDIAACLDQIDAISNAENSVLPVLRRREEALAAEKSELEGVITMANREEGMIGNRMDVAQSEQQANREKLDSEAAEAKAGHAYLTQNKLQVLGAISLTLDNSEKLEKEYGQTLLKKQQAVKDSISGLETKIVRGLTLFRRDFPNETREFDETVQSLPDCQYMLEQLDRDDLPKYEAHFKNLLTSRVIQEIAVFQFTLKQQYERVQTRIDEINKSLYTIDYNPLRYIRLNCEDSSDSEIKSFRTQLRACTEGASAGFEVEEQATARFLQIKEIIQRFQGREKETEADKKWTQKVSDVRNWFVFSASERWRENDEEYEHYTDSGGKSGGQKEKLAYTILAASLVYNYGLHQDEAGRSTLRLVVIDEAFLKSSDDSAKFGLRLFQQLKFQLVIVTPLLKIATIEPFIAHVGYINHDDITHQSSLLNIPIAVYKEKRKAWEVQHFARVDRQGSN